MADGTEFQIDIGVKADGAESAALKVAQLGDRLLAASAASTQASAAVKAAEASYKSTETAVDRASKALERVSIAAEAQRGKLQKALDVGDLSGAEKAGATLQKLVARQSDAAAKASTAKAALTQEAAALDKLRASAEKAASEETNLQKATDAAKKTAAAADQAAAKAAGTGNARQIAAGLGKLGGPLGAVGQKVFGTKEAFDKLGKSLGAAGPYVAIGVALTAIAVGVAAITVAAAAGIVKIGAWAVGLADAARDQRLLAEGITQSVKGGAALDKSLTALTNKVPLTREELSSMADQLAKSGLQGKALTDTLEANAVAAAKAKFGPEWPKEMLSLTNQSARLKSGIAGIFGGLKIEKLLEQMSSLVDLFNENDAAGKAIKVVFESLFQPLIDQTAAWIPKARAAFLQFEIYVLQALIAIKPFGSKILLVAEAFGVLSAILLGLVALAIGAVIFSVTVLAFAIAAVVAAVFAVGAAFVWLGLKMAELGTAIYNGASAGFNYLVGVFNAVVAFLQGISLVDIGVQMITGLANGIRQAAAQVVAAITGVVGGAVDAAKKKLGIASPSKVLEAEVGFNMGAGVASGLDKSADGVQSSLAGAVDPGSALEKVGGGAKAQAPSSGGGGGGSINLAGATFTFNGVKDAEDAESRFGELMTRLLEGDAAQLGAEVPG